MPVVLLVPRSSRLTHNLLMHTAIIMLWYIYMLLIYPGVYTKNIDSDTCILTRKGKVWKSSMDCKRILSREQLQSLSGLSFVYSNSCFIPHSTHQRTIESNPTVHQDTSKLLSIGSQQIVRSCHGKGLTIQATNILTTRRHQGQLVPDLTNWQKNTFHGRS